MVGTPAWAWGGFLVFIAGMMAVDLVAYRRSSGAMSFRSAAGWSVLWIGLALAFNLVLLMWRGPGPALEFLTGYVVEESLSLDNLFVFLVIFRFFALPARQYRLVLTWGILGAVILRGVMIAAGVALISVFSWAIQAFGVLLVWTAWKLFTEKEEKVEPEVNPLVRLARRFYPVWPRFAGDRFFIRRGRRTLMTPLLVVLLVVSTTDVVFATDSIPAIFAITRDPFIVFTSNMFAVMGLRSIFFMLAGVLHQFRYLREGLAVVLGLIGVKMLVEHHLVIPIPVALAVVAGVLAGSIGLSLVADRRERDAPRPSSISRRGARRRS